MNGQASVRACLTFNFFHAAEMRGQLLQHGPPAQMIVPPFFHDHVLQRLKLQYMRMFVGHEYFQPVGLLANPYLPTHFELPLSKHTPGCEALGVPPAQLSVLQAHLLHGILYHHVRTQSFELVKLVHNPTSLPLTRIRQEAVFHLGSVQVYHLEVAHIHGPVRILAGCHKLHQIARFTFVQEVLWGVNLQVGRLDALLVYAFISVVDGALHLVALVVVLLFLIRVLVCCIETAAVFQIVIVVRKYVRDADPWSVLCVHAVRVHSWDFCVT